MARNTAAYHMAAVGGFRGVPMDVQLKVAKLVMERG